jgi:hypothetical protein
MRYQESPLSQAQRHVLENEQRVARQRDIIAEMDRDEHPKVAAKARRLLETMEETLRLARQHLEFEKGRCAPMPPPR